MRTTQPLLRYPGGKSRKVRFILPRLDTAIAEHGVFVEPFVGGGSVCLTVASRYSRGALHINDLDQNIFSFWDLAVNGSDGEVQEMFRLLDRGATLEIFDSERLRCQDPSRTRAEKAYHAVFFSKTTHNGIFGASPIGGREQEGKRWKVDCQYNPENMRKTFSRIRLYLQGRTKVTNVSASSLLSSLPPEWPSYLDPPYFVAGKLCYPVWMEEREHEDLAQELRRRLNWVLSYDDCPFVRNLYSWATIEDLQFKYSMASHGKERKWSEKTELLILPKGGQAYEEEDREGSEQQGGENL